jgi:hypothetical protein
MFRYKGLGHKWLKKKRVSLVEKNVWITERFFDNHYKLKTESCIIIWWLKIADTEFWSLDAGCFTDSTYFSMTSRFMATLR